MPISNPGSGQSVSGSISVAENSHYISQQVISAEIADQPIILIPATEDKVARAYWIYNNSESLATIQMGLAPGLIIPLKPGTIYEQKDSGGLVNQVTLVSGKVTGILKSGSLLPEISQPPLDPEPDGLIFAPVANPNIVSCPEGHSVFALPSTTVTVPIYVSYGEGSQEGGNPLAISGFNSSDFERSTAPVFESDYYSAGQGAAMWQLTPTETASYIVIMSVNMYGGYSNPTCVEWVAATSTFYILSESGWANN